MGGSYLHSKMLSITCASEFCQFQQQSLCSLCTYMVSLNHYPLSICGFLCASLCTSLCVQLACTSASLCEMKLIVTNLLLQLEFGILLQLFVAYDFSWLWAYAMVSESFPLQPDFCDRKTGFCCKICLESQSRLFNLECGQVFVAIICLDFLSRSLNSGCRYLL